MVRYMGVSFAQPRVQISCQTGGAGGMHDRSLWRGAWPAPSDTLITTELIEYCKGKITPISIVIVEFYSPAARAASEKRASGSVSRCRSASVRDSRCPVPDGHVDPHPLQHRETSSRLPQHGPKTHRNRHVIRQSRRLSGQETRSRVPNYLTTGILRPLLPARITLVECSRSSKVFGAGTAVASPVLRQDLL
jgi:hypothetical protein